MIEYTTNTQTRACWVVCADCYVGHTMTHMYAHKQPAPPSHSAIARSRTTQLTTLAITEGH